MFETVTVYIMYSDTTRFRGKERVVDQHQKFVLSLTPYMSETVTVYIMYLNKNNKF